MMKKITPYLLTAVLITFCGNTSREIDSPIVTNGHNIFKVNLSKAEVANKNVTIGEIRDKYIEGFENGSVKIKKNKISKQNNLKAFDGKIETRDSHNTQHTYLNIDEKNGENE